MDNKILILNLENASNCKLRFLKFDQGSGNANAGDKCMTKLLNNTNNVIVKSVFGVQFDWIYNFYFKCRA